MDVISLADEGLGNHAYLVDLGDGRALAVDPWRDPAPVLAAAERRGLVVHATAETHLHADFVSGGRELAAFGARLLAPAAGELAFPHEGLRDGDELDLGGLTLRALGTPGHTPEHLSYLLLDGARPVALFSGGTLIAGGVARPDLVAPELTDQLARAAYRSIHDKLLPLPDDVPVYATHGGGSFCSTSAAGSNATTIGRERAENPLLQAADEDTFVARLLGGLGSFPSYFLRLRDVNRAGAPLVGRTPPSLPSLKPADVSRLAADGAVVVDARPVERFARGHLPGAVSIELRPHFATWLGWVVPFGAPVVVVLDDDQDERDLVAQALKVGYDRLQGRLAGGVAAWRADGRPLAVIPLLPPEQAGARRVVDVRQDSEWRERHVPGALHVELGALADPAALTDSAAHGEAAAFADAAAAVDGGPVLVHCGHGQRAMTGASLLRRAGVRDVAATTADVAALTGALRATG